MAYEPAPSAGGSPARVIARLARQVEVAVATVDLTLAQYRVLGHLAEGREAASGLADKIAVSRPSITGVVDGLVARGLVERTHDDCDRRRIDLDLTPAGHAVLAAADAEAARRLATIAEHLASEPAPAAPAATAAFDALGAWRDALDRHRAARATATAHAATAPPAATVPPAGTAPPAATASPAATAPPAATATAHAAATAANRTEAAR